MKGYKAFKKGMMCLNKQYAENTVFEEEEADVCQKGMHFCKNPMDCLDYYPLIDDDGNVVEIAEVEALDECKTDDNKKFCTRKLKVGAKVGIKGLVDGFIGFVKEETKIESGAADASGDWAKLASSGDWAQLASFGNWAKLASSGNGAQLASSGENSVVANIGVDGKAKASVGSWITLAEYGDWNGTYNPCKCVKSFRIDGKKYKPDTWYTLKNGKVVEAE